MVSVPKSENNEVDTAQQVESRLSHVERMWYVVKGFAEQALFGTPEEEDDLDDGYEKEQRRVRRLERASLLWVCMNDLGCDYPGDIRDCALASQRKRRV